MKAADREVIGVEQIATLAGLTYAGATVIVTEEDRDRFEHVTYVDRAYPDPDAPEFPADIVEGFHTLALLDAMSVLARPFDPATTYAFNYGLDRVRWVSPVMIGEELQSWFEVVDVTPKNDGWLVRRQCTLTVSGSDRPAVIADWLIYVLPRPTSAS